MARKQKLSVSVDAALVASVRAAVAEGRADSLSAWVNDALRLKIKHDERLRDDHERRMRAMDEFFAEYEREHGEITREEMEAARRRLRERAIVVDGRRGGKGQRPRVRETEREEPNVR